MTVAGLGFRASCTAEELVALIDGVRRTVGCEITALAVPDFKAGASELTRAASQLALEVRPIARDALIEVQSLCPSRSAAALASLGLASVAEACALAAAGPGARLLVTKVSGTAATCALAASAFEEGQGE